MSMYDCFFSLSVFALVRTSSILLCWKPIHKTAGVTLLGLMFLRAVLAGAKTISTTSLSAKSGSLDVDVFSIAGSSNDAPGQRFWMQDGTFQMQSQLRHEMGLSCSIHTFKADRLQTQLPNLRPTCRSICNLMLESSSAISRNS